MTKSVIGIDLGGTKIAAARFPAQGEPTHREAVIYWGMAVANLVSLFNPETIIFGGGVFGPAVQFLERIREEAIRWAQPISIQQVALRAAQLGDDAVLYGAGRLALPSQSECPASSS